MNSLDKTQHRYIIPLMVLGAVAVIATPLNPVNAVIQTSSSLQTASTEGSKDLQTDLQAYYRFDEESAESYTLEFDGDNDFVEIPHDSEMNKVFGGSLNFTLSSWIYVKEWENHATAIHKAKSGWWSGSTASLWIEEDGLTAVIGSNEGGNEDGSNIRITHKPALKKWHHMIAVANNTHLILYVNGERKGSKPITDYIKANLTTNTQPVTIGRRTPSHQESLNGSISEVKAFDRNLSEKEIEDLYRRNEFPASSLVIHQRFDEGSTGCDLTSGSRCLEDLNSNDGLPHNFTDNLWNSGSGWSTASPADPLDISDSSGSNHNTTIRNGNHGRLNNFSHTPSSGWTNSTLGRSSLRFDGQDDYVEVPDNEVFDLGKDDLTVSTWIKIPSDYSPANHRIIVEKAVEEHFHTSDGPGWGISIDTSGRIYGGVTDSDGNNKWETEKLTDIRDGKWHHISLVIRNGDSVETYLDGSLEDSEPLPEVNFSPSVPLGIGASADSTTRNIRASIDEVKIYSRGLSAPEVQNLYRRKKVREGLVGEWSFEKGEGGKAYDTSSKQHEGILNTESFDVSPSEKIRTDLNISSSNFSFSAWIKPQNSSWDDYKRRYRKPVVLTENSGTLLENYQVNLTVDTESLIKEEKMSSDCGDIRFFGSNSSELHHHIHSGCNSQNTSIAIKIPEIHSGSEKKIWMYYGSNYGDGGDPEETYYIYDLHGNGYSGDLINDANYRKNQGFVELTENKDGQKGAINYSNGTPEPGWKASWEYYIGDGTDADALWLYSWGSSRETTEDPNGNAVHWLLNDHDDCIGVGNNGQCGNLSNWNENPATEKWEEASAYSYREGNTLNYMFRTLGNTTSGSWTNSSFPMGHVFGFGARTGGKNNYHRIRNITVRKYVEPEPSASIGNEQRRPEIISSEDTGIVSTGEGAVFKTGRNQAYSPIQVASWHHVAGIKEENKNRLFINGELVAETQTSTSLTEQTFNLTQNLDARVDEIRIYNRSLSDREVKRLSFK